MNVLELLQQYLAQGRPVAANDARGGVALPPGLPDAVARSILGGRSYGEGETPMGRGNPAMGQEIIDNALADAPQRDQYLLDQLLQARENQRLQRLGLPFSGQATQFASPLNQMMSWPIAPGMSM